jgi:nucleotide-binding universal stress UspA family protein
LFRILLPFDGSPASVRAVEHLIRTRPTYGEAEVHLLNVRPALPGTAAGHLSGKQVKDFHQQAGEAQLAPAREMLDRAKVSYVPHVGVGETGETIARHVRELGIDQIVMGTRGLGAIRGALLGSIATEVISLCAVPVLLVK